jgi:hypothetical protein
MRALPPALRVAQARTVLKEHLETPARLGVAELHAESSAEKQPEVLVEEEQAPERRPFPDRALRR